MHTPIDFHFDSRQYAYFPFLSRKHGVQLRGQTKTHKTVEGGVLQTGGTRLEQHMAYAYKSATKSYGND